MQATGRRKAAIMLALSVAAAVWGQYTFKANPHLIWDGLVWYAVAMVLFGAAIGTRRREQMQGLRLGLAGQLWRAVDKSRWRAAALGVAFAMAVWAGIVADGRPDVRSFAGPFAAWAVGILLAIAAVLDWPELKRKVTTWQLSWPKPEPVIVAVLVLATIAIRAFDLENIPFVILGDEASMGLEAIRFIEGTRHNPFTTGWLSHPTLYFWFLSQSLRIGGITTSALRAMSPLVSGGIALFVYALAKQYWGRRTALLATLFFCCYHYAIHFGRLALNNIWDPLFATGVFWVVLRGLETGRRSDFGLAGVLLGFCVYFYMGARLIPIVLVVLMIYLLLTQHERLSANVGNLVLCVVFSLIVAMPLAIHIRSHPSDLMARYNWVGIFPSGWVESEVARTGKSELVVFLGQFLKAALAYNCIPDPTYWYRPGIPLLRFLSSIFFVYGLVDIMRQWRKPHCFMVALWFWMVAIFGGALMDNPPTSTRLVLGIPAVVICVAVGVVRLADLASELAGQRRVVGQIASALVVLVMSFGSVRFYYTEYTPSQVFAGQTTQVADRMAKYLVTLGSGAKCFFFGPPRMYADFPTIPFLAQDAICVDVPQPLQPGGAASIDAGGLSPVFVFLPERRSELDVVRQTYPAGSLREFRDDKGQILFVAYEADG